MAERRERETLKVRTGRLYTFWL